MKKMRKLLNNKKGFTLIELLVVLAVLGILATIAVPRFTGMQGKANEVKHKTELKQFQTALELYYAEHNTYPVDTADNLAIRALVSEYIEVEDLVGYVFTDFDNDDAGDYTVTATVESVSYTISRSNIVQD